MIKLIKEKFFQEDSKMKISKRVLSVLLVVLMLLTSAPLGGVTDWFSNRASAATNANAKAVVDNICGTVGYRPGVDNYNDCYAYVSAFCKKMYGSAPGGVSGYTLTRPGSFYLVGQAAGTGVTAASLSSVLSQAMPGDVVQMYWDYGTGHGQHTAIVYSADSRAFTILQDGASFSTIKKSTYNYSSNYTRWRGSGYGISLYRHSNYNNLFGSNDTTAPTTAHLSINKTEFTIGESFTLNLSSDVFCQYYLSVFDADSNEKIIGENVSNVFSCQFNKAGHYVAYMSAFNPKGSVDSPMVHFYFYGSPASTAELTVDKNEIVPNETINYALKTDAYYTKNFVSIFRNDVKVYEGDVSNTFSYKPTEVGKYLAYVSAYTCNGTKDSNWVAVYVGKYTVKYNVNGGTGTISDQTKVYGKSIKLSSTTPQKSGATFKCWNTKLDGTGTNYKPGDLYKDNKSVTLYAIWTTNHTHSYTSKITKSPTCTATGVKTYTCPCGDSYTETIAKTAHSYTSKTITSTYLKSGATCISPAVYYYKCASCSAKGTTTYTYGSALGHTGGTANCTDKAVCTRCQTAYGSVNASNHKSVVKDPAVIATCTDTGKTEGSHCEACGKVLVEQTTLSALGHTESDWIFDGDGTKHTECTVCHAVLRTETTEECDHSEKKSEYIVTPTCTQPGKLVYICNLCDEQLGEEDVEPLGHSYDIETVTKATLSKNGAVVQTCFDCDAKKTVRTIYYPKTFAVAAQVYTGKALKPSVTVKDSAGKTISSANYTVTYANNVAIGTATAKVTFRGNYSGTKTLIFAIVPAQVSKPKATQTTSSVTLSWSKVAGSNMRYYVFSYNPGTKKYTCLGYTTGTSYTVKKLSSGTTYYFAVQAYNTTAKKWGKVSSVLTTATKPGTPTLKAVAGTRKATLSWNKQNGATGYLLYMATSKNGKYTKIATLKGNTKVSYTKTGLTKGRYYYFKVIAYKTVGSTNIYGAYSSVKYVKVK